MEKIKTFNPQTLGCQFWFWCQKLSFYFQPVPTMLQKKNINPPTIDLWDHFRDRDII
jgi:hypothetical protein